MQAQLFITVPITSCKGFFTVLLAELRIILFQRLHVVCAYNGEKRGKAAIVTWYGCPRFVLVEGVSTP